MDAGTHLQLVCDPAPSTTLTNTASKQTRATAPTTGMTTTPAKDVSHAQDARKTSFIVAFAARLRHLASTHLSAEPGELLDLLIVYVQLLGLLANCSPDLFHTFVSFSTAVDITKARMWWVVRLTEAAMPCVPLLRSMLARLLVHPSLSVRQVIVCMQCTHTPPR